jgi:hypothetical protein
MYHNGRGLSKKRLKALTVIHNYGIRRTNGTTAAMRWLTLSKINAENPAAVYTQDKEWDDDPHRFFIFNNEAALKEIRWRYFLSDCKPLMANHSMVGLPT